MRTMLIVGDGRGLSGTGADRIGDDLASLLKGLKNTSAYRQILIRPTERFFLPPENPLDLLPLADLDEQIIEEAKKHPGEPCQKVLKASSAQALALFYETLFSFVTGRQMVLIPSFQKFFPAILPYCTPAETEGLQFQRVEKESLPLLGGVREWPWVFGRPERGWPLERLIPGRESLFCFPGDVKVPMKEVLARMTYVLRESCRASYPATDALNNPRALLLRGQRRGFLLVMPEPEKIKNLAITLQTGNGISRDRDSAAPGTRAPELTRDWMTREETAAAIGKSKDTVDNYCRDGTLSSSKSGRQVRITKESVQRFLDGRA